MSKTIVVALLLFVLVSNGSASLMAGLNPKGPQDTGTLEKMIVASGSVVMDLDLNRFGGAGVKGSRPGALRFDIEHNSLFSVLVFNDELRGPMPSSMALISQNSLTLPGRLGSSYQNLVIEKLPMGAEYDMVVRDGRSNFVFFYIEGHELDYQGAGHSLRFQGGRLRMSQELASELGRPADANAVVGKISISATLQPVESAQIVNGEVRSETMLGRSPESGSVPGPDVVVGDLSGLAQFGSQSGTQVGLAVGTDSCNYGVENLHWFQNPDNDHPVIPQNLYRMSGGATNDERFEQVGQSFVKHAFTALTNNICGLGCNGVGGANLGSGCSDPYSANLNSGPNLGSRAWINPYTGAYPRNDAPTTPNNSHGGHSHVGPSHRILTEVADLVPAQNPGATYYAEGQYITPHEYAWCQTHPGQCNMNNNVSYRRYNVTNSASPFTFSPVGSTVRQKAAIIAWTGATIVNIEPAPGVDGIGAVGYKVTNPSPGVWHYEYAIYNQNMDRGIQSFSVPVGSGASLSSVGFHAPPQHPGWANDGTLNNAGYSSAPWAQSQAGGAMTWSSETVTANVNANALRWGTLYNYRFDSNRPPQTANATIGFYKTGAPITVQVQGPSPAVVANFTVSGRVFTSGGLPIRAATVVLSDPSITRFATTSSFGFYVFENVPAGTYTISVSSKRYSFNPLNVPVSGNLADMDLTALPK